MAKRLGDTDLAIIDKRRPRANVATVMNIIGEVNGKTCVLVDDLVDTAGTLCAAAVALKQNGATKVVAYITHPVLSGPAMDNINNSELDELVVTDTIPLSDAARECRKFASLVWLSCLLRLFGVLLLVNQSVHCMWIDCMAHRAVFKNDSFGRERVAFYRCEAVSQLL